MQQTSLDFNKAAPTPVAEPGVIHDPAPIKPAAKIKPLYCVYLKVNNRDGSQSQEAIICRDLEWMSPHEDMACLVDLLKPMPMFVGQPPVSVNRWWVQRSDIAHVQQFTMLAPTGLS